MHEQHPPAPAPAPNGGLPPHGAHHEAPAPHPEPARKSWFARHKVLTGAAALVLIVVIATAGGGGEEEPGSQTAAPAETVAADPPAVEDEAAGDDAADEPAAPEEEPAEEPAPTTDPLVERYGTFDVVELSGTGDGVIPVPSTVGMVTATHDGTGNFAISALDADAQPTGDLLVNEIGAYSGTTAYGLTAFSDATTLQISANGAWTLRIEPLAAAPALDLPTEGTGDTVFRYDGAAGAWSITHAGSANIIVVQDNGGIFPNLMVNDIGAYEGTVPVQGGPSVVTVQADGAWTLTS
jgi:hypothetical protein